MQFTNITNSEKIVYGVSFILSIITYFIFIGFFDEKTTTGISALMFFVYTYFGLYIVRKGKLILEIHNGVLEKNSLLIKQSGHISFLGFKGKTEAYVENLLLNIAKS